MAGNQHYQRRFGVAKASTWGTAPTIVSTGALIHLNQPGDSWDISGGITRAMEYSENNNINETHNQRHAANFAVNAHYDLNGQGLLHLIAAFMGASTDSPTENNGGEGDYAHEIVLSAETAKMVGLAGLLESDQITEAPTAQPTSLTISANENDPVRVQISGMCYRRISTYSGSTTNSVAEIGAMTYPTPDLAYCNAKTNLWCRVNALTGGALSGSDNKSITGFSYTVTRQPVIDYVFQVGNTGFPLIPKYPAPFSTYELTLNFDRLDDSYFDVLGSFQDGDTYKAHLICDGSQIGSGDNATLEIWIPKMRCITPINLASQQATQMRPSITFQCMEHTSTPTGFPSGCTLGQIDVIANVSVDLA